MEQVMELAAKRKFESDMTAALAKLKGEEGTPAEAPAADPTPSPETEAPVETAPAETPETPETPEPEAPPSDEWVELQKQFGSAAALREHLENQRAMSAEAHQRNAEARQLAEEARQQATQTAKMQAELRAQMSVMSELGQEDPALAQRLWAKAGRSNISTEAAAGPEVAQLQASMARMEQQLNAQRFAHNQAITVAAANEAIARSEVLTELAKADKSVAAEMAQEVVQKLYDRDMRSPGSVVPTNPATFGLVVDEALRSVERKYKAISEGGVKAWKAKHAVNAAKGPPSGKGPSASARTVPQELKRPANMNMRQAGDFFAKSLKREIEARKNGTR